MKTEREIVEFVANLVGDIDIAEETAAKNEGDIERFIPLDIVKAARDILYQPLQPKPTSIELFEAKSAAIRTAALDILGEIKSIEQSPFHQGLSEAIVAIRGLSEACEKATDAMFVSLTELKRSSNGRVEVAPSGGVQNA